MIKIELCTDDSTATLQRKLNLIFLNVAIVAFESKSMLRYLEYGYNQYMYRRSVAEFQSMAVKSTNRVYTSVESM